MKLSTQAEIKEREAVHGMSDQKGKHRHPLAVAVKGTLQGVTASNVQVSV